jgi:hypothetical protein
MAVLQRSVATLFSVAPLLRFSVEHEMTSDLVEFTWAETELLNITGFPDFTKIGQKKTLCPAMQASSTLAIIAARD